MTLLTLAALLMLSPTIPSYMYVNFETRSTNLRADVQIAIEEFIKLVVVEICTTYP